MEQLEKVTLPEDEMWNSMSERIKELKKEKSLTDQLIADKLQYHAKHVNRMLNSPGQLTEDTINRLSELFGVSPEFLKGESDFRTVEERENHLIFTKYSLIIDLVTSIAHLNIRFFPIFAWDDQSRTTSEMIFHLTQAVDGNGTDYHVVDKYDGFEDIIGGEGRQYYTFKEYIPEKVFFDYDKKYMGKGNLHLFHEIKHNEKRVGYISHEKFLYLMDHMNNTIASETSFMLTMITD